MKAIAKALLFMALTGSFLRSPAQGSVSNSVDQATGSKHLFIDVHRLTPGKVKLKDVAQAHAQDLAVEGKYNVQFLKYWVDESKGLVFCLASANDTESIRQTHAEAHGLLPQKIYPVTAGVESAFNGNKNLFLDIHYIGPGKVSANDVAGAHEKDLAVQGKYGVNLTNYWLDEKEGVVMCLAEAKDSSALIKTHKEAHGLVPDKVFKVKQGQ